MFSVHIYMKKFILIGGYPHKAADGGKALCEEMVKGFSEPIRILDCLFARPLDNWEKAHQQDKEFFPKNLPNSKLDIELAQPSVFLDQLEKTDVLYFRGGSTGALMKALGQFPNWSEKLDGKTIAGSSAGMDMLARYCFNLDTLQLEDGLGLLPIKTIPHWKSDYNAPNINWDDAKQSLSEYMEDLPIVTLGEGEFKVFEISK